MSESIEFLPKLANVAVSLVVNVDWANNDDRLPLAVVLEILNRKCAKFELFDMGTIISISEAEQLLQVGNVLQTTGDSHFHFALSVHMSGVCDQ